MNVEVKVLEMHGVKILDKYSFKVECGKCGTSWIIPESMREELLPDRYWECPMGCNSRLTTE